MTKKKSLTDQEVRNIVVDILNGEEIDSTAIKFGISKYRIETIVKKYLPTQDDE